tara:strand:+ start:131 stop:970 length:840 start_codon:yes stop_codon:yes gene_type:complete
MHKILITYVYFENKRSLKNLKFFISNGVFCNKVAHYNFIIKGEKCSAKIPSYDNITVYKVNNEGYDFAGYSYSINTINKDIFDYFIFLNDSVIGPFIPRYISKEEWYIHFVNLISDKTKLVGATINKKSYNGIPKHVQSMAFATDNIGLQLLIDNNIFNLERNIQVFNKLGKDSFIIEFEVGMSGIIMDNGYKIESFMQTENNNFEIGHGDIHYNNKYFGSTLNPIEIMFLKNNRISSKILKNYITWNQNAPSSPVCRHHGHASSCREGRKEDVSFVFL